MPSHSGCLHEAVDALPPPSSSEAIDVGSLELAHWTLFENENLFYVKV